MRPDYEIMEFNGRTHIASRDEMRMLIDLWHKDNNVKANRDYNLHNPVNGQFVTKDIGPVYDWNVLKRISQVTLPHKLPNTLSIQMIATRCLPIHKRLFKRIKRAVWGR